MSNEPASLNTQLSTLNSPPVRAFLFDIGNVLLRFDFSLALKRLAIHSAAHDPLEVLGLIDRVKSSYEEGQIDRASFLRGVFDVLRYAGTEPDFITAWEDIFEPNAPMIALVEQLHGRFPLYLLSNTSDIHRDYVFRQYEFFSRFTDGVYSYEARLSKPSPAIFIAACQCLHLEPAATFFIDDLLPNIEAARTLGFICHHYHHERHHELLDQLAQLGVSLQTSPGSASVAADVRRL